MNEKANIYLKRYAYPGVHLKETPVGFLGIIVVIPVYDESNLIFALNSLKSCALPNSGIEVIIVINHEQNASQGIEARNYQTKQAAEEWIKNYSGEQLKFIVIYKPDLPKKQAGVGLARKIGMDEAVRRFEMVGNDQGIIACLDADCTVEKNYFKAIYEHWKKYPECNGVSIYYEHPVDNEYEIETNGIIDYELHLRYYVNAQKFAGFPFAFQTVGSCMAVTSQAYQKQGGMNKRKAGEDFWFLQKIFQLGNYHNLNTTCVIPSSRPSYRVPFGTGKFIQTFLNQDKKRTTTTYHFNTFRDLKVMLQNTDRYYTQPFNEVSGLPEGTKAFLDAHDFDRVIKRILQNSASLKTFRKGFYQWFDGFKLMKYVHFHRDHYYPDDELDKQVDELFERCYGSRHKFSNNRERLLYIREKDRNAN